MRIAFLTPEYARPGYPAGGLANYLRRLTGLLESTGHEPIVFLAGAEDRIEVIDGVKIYEIAAYDRRPLWARWKFSCFLTYYKFIKTSEILARAFIKVHQSHPFHIVQSASYRFPGLGMAKKNILPVAVRVSSYTPMLRTAINGPQKIGAHLIDWAELKQMQMATRLFAPSYLLAQSLKRIKGLDVEVVRTPFIMDKVEEDEAFYHGSLGGKKYLFFWGKMNRVKGADLLIRALPEVLDQHKNLHVGFVGVDSPIGGGISCVNLMKEKLGVYADRIHYWPKLEKAQLYPLIRNAYGIVMPSRIDNYPNACLEAQYLGKVVIGTRDSSLDEMIIDGVNGLLVERDSKESLREGIMKFLALPNDRVENMGNKALEVASNRSPSAAVENLLKFYERTIADFNKGHI